MYTVCPAILLEPLTASFPSLFPLPALCCTQRRMWLTTIVEIGLPVLIMAIIVAVRGAIPDDYYDLDLHTEDAQSLNSSQQLAYLALYPSYDGPPNTQKIVFTASSPSIDPTPIAAAFVAAYPVLAASVKVDGSSTDVDKYMKASEYGVGADNPYYAAVVQLNTLGTAANGWQWDYTLRFNSSLTAGNSDVWGYPGLGGDTVNTLHWVYDNTWYHYITNGNAFLQQFMDTYILHQSTGTTQPLNATLAARQLTGIPFPTPPYIVDNFASAVGTFLGLLFVIIFQYPVTRVVKLIVEEKESRIKEGLKMMGLKPSTLWLSWLITYLIIYIITSILITIITADNVFKYSSKALIFFFFLLSQLSFFTFALLFSTLFSNARAASTFSALVFIGAFFPYYAVFQDSTPSAQKTVACLSSPLCFGLGINNIIEYEGSQQGVNSGNAGTTYDGFSYSHAMGMLLLDTVLYLLAAVYFDQVMQGDYGVALPWYFPVQASYWCPRPTALAQQEVKDDELPASSVMERVEFADGEQQQQHQLGVRIRKLYKEFRPDKSLPPFKAVDNLSVDLYTGQIFALLGHNGAGSQTSLTTRCAPHPTCNLTLRMTHRCCRVSWNVFAETTTLSMLSGLMPPTSGDAQVFGQSIRTQMPLIRETLGVCPQHNILWPILTVQEHLQLYAGVKGVPRAELQQAVDDMIQQVGLTEKRHVASAALSGGMQRKLSVGIALIGDSRIVFLDEPTSGMDPYSRRATWDLLKKRKEGRVIILTTHFMDEADSLGDRIAIMASGHLQCVGSSLFLKTRFGVGYSLVITKAGGQCDEDAIHDAIEARVDNAELVNNIAGELSYKLPFAASPNFPDLFDTFDQHQQPWGIQSYGISVTTLEEVFLKVGKDAAAHAKIHGQSRANSKLIPATIAAALEADGDDEKVDSGLKTVQVKPREEKTTPYELASPTPQQYAQSSRSDLLAGVPLSSPSAMRPLNSPGAAAGSGPGSPVGAMASPPTATAATAQVDALGHGVLYDKSHPKRRHIRALLLKRYQNAKRNRKNWCWTIIIPFLVMVVFLGIIKGLNDVNTDVDAVMFNDLNSPEQMPYAVMGNSTAFMSNVAGTSEGGLSVVQPLDVTGLMPDPSNATQFADWLYTSESQLQLSRYGAIVYQARTNLHNASLPLVADNVGVYTNTTYLYSLPLYYSTYNTALLRYLTGSPTAQITLNVWPFPQTANSQVLVNSITAIVIGIAFAFIPSNYIYYTVKEKSIKSKHQQFISGVTPFTYHAAHFAWDFINYLVPAILCLIVIAIYDISELIGENVGATIVALLLYGLSIVPFSAFCSFLFNSPTTAQNTMLIFYILTSCFLLIISIVLGIISSTKNIATSLRFVFRLLPSYCLGEAIAFLITRSSVTAFGTVKSQWSMDVTGWAFVYMAIESVGYSLAVLAIEYILETPALFEFFSKRVNVPLVELPEEDDDVRAERKRLQSLPPAQPTDDEPISIRGLRKVYPSRLGVPPKVAVHDLWLGIHTGEVFGLLGINGAGKTSAMKMLTNDVYPTTGDAYLTGLSILTSQQSIKEKIGFCPQFDALIGTLTAREHLQLFARLKGVDERILSQYVQSMIDYLGLQDGIADRPCKGYSGGNKRKLCVGMALIGNPPVIFLDEPSTGMDPASRRFMWNLIAHTMKGRAVILTTHSMEESEALCQRIAIMVGGSLRCLGSAQRLKSLYGSGYQLEVNLADGSRKAQFVDWLRSVYQHAAVLEEQETLIKYEIGRQTDKGEPVTIGGLFRHMERVKAEYGIKEYAVSETSLEQIFIRFAQTQKEEKGAVAGLTSIRTQQFE